MDREEKNGPQSGLKVACLVCGQTNRAPKARLPVQLRPAVPSMGMPVQDCASFTTTVTALSLSSKLSIWNWSRHATGRPARFASLRCLASSPRTP